LSNPQGIKGERMGYGIVTPPLNSVLPNLTIAALLSVVITIFVTPIFNRFFVAIGVAGTDIMKRERLPVADMGGPGVIVGFLSGVFAYIAFAIFMRQEIDELINILASISTILIISLIGLFDVLTSLLKQREGQGIFERMKRRGIPGWVYFFIPLPAAVPLAAVKAGVSSMALPFFGKIELGNLYPLVLIPLAVLCCSNATNFLAGFNGLEAGMGLVLHASLGIYALYRDRTAAALIAFTFAAALLAFLRYNWYPAKVFPGDLNYTIGAACVCVTVIGNMERFAILCFTPWVIEAFLKASSRFQAESFGVLQEDGTVKPSGEGNYSLTHLAMRLGDFNELQISSILIGFEVIICILSFMFVQYT